MIKNHLYSFDSFLLLLYKVEVCLPLVNHFHTFAFILNVAVVFLMTVNQLKFRILPVKLNKALTVRKRNIDAVRVLTACFFSSEKRGYRNIRTAV